MGGTQAHDRAHYQLSYKESSAGVLYVVYIGVCVRMILQGSHRQRERESGH